MLNSDWFSDFIQAFSWGTYTFAQWLAFVNDVVIPFRTDFIQTVTSGSVDAASAVAHDGSTNGFIAINAVITVLDGQTYWTEVSPFSLNGFQVLYPTADQVNGYFSSPDQYQITNEVVFGGAATSGFIKSIVAAINSLQTNVSINHGQAIFSVQGGSITGP
jgi:hypothetical protein